jgi:hypothetical protein
LRVEGWGCRILLEGSDALEPWWVEAQGSGFTKGSGFGDQGSGIRVQGSGFRVRNSGFRVQGSRFRVQDSGFKVQGLLEGSDALEPPRF